MTTPPPPTATRSAAFVRVAELLGDDLSDLAFELLAGGDRLGDRRIDEGDRRVIRPRPGQVAVAARILLFMLAAIHAE